MTGLILGTIALGLWCVPAGHAALGQPPNDRELDRKPGIRPRQQGTAGATETRPARRRGADDAGAGAGGERRPRRLYPRAPPGPDLVAAQGRGALSRRSGISSDEPRQGCGSSLSGGHGCRPLASGGSGRFPRRQPGAALAVCHRESLGRRACYFVEGLRSGDARVPADRAGDANPLRAGEDRPDRVGQAALALRGRRSRGLGGTSRPGQRRAGAGPAPPTPSATCETVWMPNPRTPASGATT